jgi:exodeoxyribonuclease V gamma subunit
MLYLYPSNKTETLAQILSKLQSTPPLADPFASEIVLTQSYGMGVWLKQRISDHQGIACMVDTQMPGAFLWQLIESLVSEKSEHS